MTRSDSWAGATPLVENVPSGRLVSVSLPAPGLDAGRFLQAAQGEARFFWRDGQDPVTFAGFGIAADFHGLGPLRVAQIARQARRLFDGALLETHPAARPRLFGGFAFRDDFAPDNTWSSFHPAHFVLPHYQLVIDGPDAWLTLNALVADDEAPAALVPELRTALRERLALLLAAPAPAPAPANPVDRLRFPLSEAAWAAMVERATARMRGAADLQKVVLSRVCELRFQDPVQVTGALERLNAAYPHSYRFLFEPQPGHAFFGATPELLVKVDGERLWTMGLAGTTGRSSDSAADDALGQALLASAKDRHEHALVVNALRERLAPLTRELSVPAAPTMLRLRTLQHLYTPISGRLQAPDGVLPLVALLHPTPALGGAPLEAAMRFIQEAEPVIRGWYAAPVGWIDANLDGVFAVAIRSAVSQHERVWLYAGAGIVADSEPVSEWRETGLKFLTMAHALGVGPALRAELGQ